MFIVLQVAVFSPPAARNHYLNITPNNLVRIYCREDDKSTVNTRHIATFAEEDLKVHQELSDTVPSNSQSVIRKAAGTCFSSKSTPSVLKPNTTSPRCSKFAAKLKHGINHISDSKQRMFSLVMKQSDTVTGVLSSCLPNNCSPEHPGKSCAVSASTNSSWSCLAVSDSNSETNPYNSVSTERPHNGFPPDGGNTSDQMDGVASLWQDGKIALVGYIKLR